MDRIALSLLLSLAMVGCGDDDVTTDGGTDGGGGGDAATDGGAATIEDIPVEEQLSVPGLEGEVSAVQDDRGMWHIYAETLVDATRAEGYLMARDRFGEMEFIRRSATGRLAEAGGDGYFQGDVDARFLGNRRNAQAIWDALDDENKTLLEAFSAGVTAYVEQIRTGELQLPRGVKQLFDVLALGGLVLDDWTPLDTLAIARLQAAQLSYDVGDDIGMTEALLDFQTAFPVGDPDARLAARSGAFHDFYSFAPSRDVFTRDGFPNEGTDTGSRALPLPHRPRATTHPVLPERSQVRAAREFADRIEGSFQRLFGDETRGSNSWVVHGDHTSTGNPLLANDPHLSLGSPPLFWMVHLDTMRAGGDVDVEGLALAGTPVVLLGYNESIAWGLTTHGFDVTDVYLETITPGTGGAPDTVLYKGEQIPIQTTAETIRVMGGTEREVVFEYVETPDQVGPPRFIIPSTRRPTSAFSVKWTGNEPTFEAFAFVALARARNVDEARAAYELFGVGGQNLVVASKEGDIFWSTQVHLPVRDARALTYDPTTGTGVAPCFVLPGTGDYEWIDMLSDRYLPHDLNPARGFIATANNDGVGVTSDGNPFDASHYIGWSFDDGHRIARITERVQEDVTRGGVTAQDLSDVQNDHQSPFGRLTRDALVAELARAAEEAATPGTHPDLTAAVAAAGTDGVARLATAQSRLEAWTFETPPDASDDGVATTIFNAAIGRVLRNALGDEFDAIGHTSGFRMRLLLRMLNDPESLITYDAALSDSILWDDITTPEVESRGDRVVSAFLDALDYLATRFGSDDMSTWSWGDIHTLTLTSIIPREELNIPAPMDPMFPHGFPRPGDNGGVDAANYGNGELEDFTYGSGPQQRLVVEMTPSGPVAVNAIPGGESQDPDSPHQHDQMDLWRMNQTSQVWFTEQDVVAHNERRVVFAP